MKRNGSPSSRTATTKTLRSPTATRVAVVTGSTRGIGAAIAKRLATDGFALVINYANQISDAERVVAEIQDAGGRALAIMADVSNPEDVNALFDGAESAFGGIDVLVNNAGIMQPGSVSLVDTGDALFDRLFAVNVKGTFNTLRMAANRLRSGGRIVNLSTSVVGLALPGYSVYAAAKSAVETMTNIFAKELRGHGISVNAVAPGPTATELFLKARTREQLTAIAKLTPFERLGQPNDIASVVSFLAGPDGAWVNGQTLRVNGGMV
jgi:3-oxoacyl-[acyl-carrier protein] reductase